MFFNKKIVFLFLALVFLSFNINANDSFEATVLIKETANDGKVIYKNKENIVFSNGSLNKKIKYSEELKEIIKRVIIFEAKYKDEDLYFVDTFEDKNNIWTMSINVMSNDISVTHFVVKYSDITVNGWINRNNKDIFGLRIFNF